MNGPFFENFVRHHFNIFFASVDLNKTVVASFLMDNDPSQTSKAARKEM